MDETPFAMKRITQFYDMHSRTILLFNPILIVFIAILVMACSSKDQKSNSGKVKVILDTDMGSDCDDVGALALLHQYADIGKAEIIGCVYSSGKIPYGAGVIEAINIYYGRPDIPVGASWKDDIGDPVDKMGAEKLAKDTATYKNRIIHNRDAAEMTALTRQLLSRQEEQSVDYVTIGHTKGLYDLLTSGEDQYSPLSGHELVSKKIRRWIALGALNANNEEGHLVRDWNFFFNGTAPYTEYLVQHFPRPAYFINAGTDVMTGRLLRNIEEDTIVRKAYEQWLWNYAEQTLDDQRPSWDLIAVYFAVEGWGKFLHEEEPGWLEFDAVKGCRWVFGGNQLDHHLVVQDKGTSQAFGDYLNTMISGPPLNNQ